MHAGPWGSPWGCALWSPTARSMVSSPSRRDWRSQHCSNSEPPLPTFKKPACVLLPPCSYAFGITLWELYTGCKPFLDIPPAFLGHKVGRVQQLGR